MIRLIDLFPQFALDDTHDKLHILGELGLIPPKVETVLCFILSDPTIPLTPTEMEGLVGDLNRVETTFLAAEKVAAQAMQEAILLALLGL